MRKKWIEGCAVLCAVAIGLYAAAAETTDVFQAQHEITIISRESGSGTRSAFTDLFSLTKKEEGTVKDMTSQEAIITNKTGVAMIDVASNPSAIGYISLGSLDDTIKALALDGVSASVDSIRSGEYTASRAFYLVLGAQSSPVREDFMSFVQSQQGQAIAEDHGYVSIMSDASEYVSKGVQGKLVVAGSSSVSPLIETITQAYLECNPNATVEVQMNDSASGIAGAIEGTCDIGMSSRELTQKEKLSVEDVAIALDGILIIVHPSNPVDSISSETIREIYLGNLPSWETLV